MTENEQAALAKLARGCTVLELGSHLGTSTLALATTATVVHAVDWHYGDDHNGHGDSLPGYFVRTRGIPNIVSHVGRFDQVVPAFADDHFDLVFIDGYHTEQAVHADIDLTLRVLKVGGTMAFHDYTIQEFGVKKAVLNRLGTPDQIVDSLAVIRHV